MSRFFVFFVFLALFIDLLTDKVQPLSRFITTSEAEAQAEKEARKKHKKRKSTTTTTTSSSSSSGSGGTTTDPVSTKVDGANALSEDVSMVWDASVHRLHCVQVTADAVQVTISFFCFFLIREDFLSMFD